MATGIGQMFGKKETLAEKKKIIRVHTSEITQNKA
jgi:hypothetical protein